MSRPLRRVGLDAPEYSAYRSRLLKELDYDRAPVLEPAKAYSYLFLELVDPILKRRVADAYRRYSGRYPGLIYCFRDVRDAPGVYKVGMSRQRGSVETRIQQWRRDLGATRDELFVVTHAYTSNCALAEQVLFVLLHNQRIRDRFSQQDNHQMTEYFLVRSLHSLIGLIHAVCQHVQAVR